MCTSAASMPAISSTGGQDHYGRTRRSAYAAGTPGAVSVPDEGRGVLTTPRVVSPPLNRSRRQVGKARLMLRG